MSERSHGHNAKKPNYTLRRIGVGAVLAGTAAAAAAGMHIKDSVDQHNSAPACAAPVMPGEGVIKLKNRLNEAGADLDNRWTNDLGTAVVLTGKPGEPGVRVRNGFENPEDARLDVASGLSTGVETGDYVGFKHVPAGACREVGGVVLRRLPSE